MRTLTEILENVRSLQHQPIVADWQRQEALRKPVGRREADSPINRISAIPPCEFRCTLVEDWRVATVTTRESLDLPIHVNQDEEELGNMKKLPEFAKDLGEAGMNKEMNPMKDFDACVEEKIEDLTQEEVDSAISVKC